MVCTKKETYPLFLSKPNVRGKNYEKNLRYYAMRKALEWPVSPISQQDDVPLHFSAHIQVSLYTELASLGLEEKIP